MYFSSPIDANWTLYLGKLVASQHYLRAVPAACQSFARCSRLLKTFTRNSLFSASPFLSLSASRRNAFHISPWMEDFFNELLTRHSTLSLSREFALEWNVAFYGTMMHLCCAGNESERARAVCAQKGHCAMKRVRAANYRGAAQVFSLLAFMPQSPRYGCVTRMNGVPLESSLIFLRFISLLYVVSRGKNKHLKCIHSFLNL
jgi:hypothetical protein